MAYSLIDIQSSPYSSPDAIRAEISKVRKLPDSPERKRALADLSRFLEMSTSLHGGKG